MLISYKAKTHGMREFMLMNDRLSMFVTMCESKMAFVQKSLVDKKKPVKTGFNNHGKNY